MKANEHSHSGPGVRSRIVLVHASILIVIGLGNAINTLVGGLAGAGLYPFLRTNHIGAVGLVQAYLLMVLIGVSLWIACRTSRPLPRAWHWVAMAAHVPPLIAIAAFASSTAEMTGNVLLASLVVHPTGMAVEIYAAIRRSGSRTTALIGWYQ